MRIRPIASNDRAGLQALLREVQLFEPHEIQVAEALIEEQLSGSTDYAIDVAERPGDVDTVDARLDGFVCHGHDPVTDAVHDIYWIVVAPSARRRGIGRALLKHAEGRVRARSGRAIVIETSSRPEYRGAHELYESCGYRRVAEIPDFYKPGDAMRTYMKDLAGPAVAAGKTTEINPQIPESRDPQIAARALSVAVIYNPVERGGDAVVRGVIDSAREAHAAINALGHRVSLLRVDEGIRPFIDALEAVQPDVVFNLCEGYRESSAGEYGVAALLELLGLPYTGSGAVALSLALDKALAKEVFMARGIPTPRFAVHREMPADLGPLTFPLMLKLAAEDASLGITPANVVADQASALTRMQQLFDEFQTPVLVEEFVDGREFTVALYNGRPLLVEEIEIHVVPRIVGFRAKWEAGSPEYDGTRPVFSPDITADQRDDMLALAARVWAAIGMRDYARVDFRMDGRGRIFVLEANPNPDISAGSGYRRSLEAANIAYRDFIATLIGNALGRLGPGRE